MTKEELVEALIAHEDAREKRERQIRVWQYESDERIRRAKIKALKIVGVILAVGAIAATAYLWYAANLYGVPFSELGEYEIRVYGVKIW